MVTRYEPDAVDTYRQLSEYLRDRHWQQIFSEDGSQVDDQIAQLLTGRRIATAESCTGGLLSARLTERPGSSAYLDGGSSTRTLLLPGGRNDIRERSTTVAMHLLRQALNGAAQHR